MLRLQIRNCSGFTLIETMVSAVVLGIAVTGIMAMIGIGTTLETEDGLRRQARMFAANALEQPVYLASNYAALAAGPGPWPGAPIVTLKTSYGNDVPAVLSVTVSPAADLALNNANAGGAVLVPYKILTAQVTWTMDGNTETLDLQKTISEVP